MLGRARLLLAGTANRLSTPCMHSRPVLKQLPFHRTLKTVNGTPLRKLIDKLDEEMKKGYVEAPPLLSSEEDEIKDPDQTGSYPKNIPYERAFHRDARAGWWDEAGRRNFGETVPLFNLWCTM
jgi:hypothetical protein